MIRLRPADEADIAIFFWLRGQIDPTLTGDAHEAWWHDVEEHRFVADDEGGKPVGVIRLAPDGTVSLQVAEGERGLGYGTEMLGLIKHEARARGYTILQARVDRNNRGSQIAFLAAAYAPVRFEVAL